jgi:SPP1 family predicted phage head-tail adaptor
MRYGRLDRRITLQRRSGALTDSGQPVDTWTDLASRWASVVPASGREGYSTPQTVATQQVEMQIRYSAAVADLHPGDRIIHPSGSADAVAVYDIVAVHEIGRRDALKIIAERMPVPIAFAAVTAGQPLGLLLAITKAA